jgi:thymidine kinase
MAQLYFYYSAMNAGKSTALLQSAYNYRERGMNPVIFTAALDDRFELGKVTSRLGIDANARLFASETNIFHHLADLHQERKVDCLLIDEAQFLNKEQVRQLTRVVDELKVPVLAYGLRTDFQGEAFIGSQYLLAWADKLIELKTVCHCGRKANFVVRFDADGNAITEGEQVEIGGNDRYESMCRAHFNELVWLKSENEVTKPQADLFTN